MNCPECNHEVIAEDENEFVTCAMCGGKIDASSDQDYELLGLIQSVLDDQDCTIHASIRSIKNLLKGVEY